MKTAPRAKQLDPHASGEKRKPEGPQEAARARSAPATEPAEKASKPESRATETVAEAGSHERHDHELRASAARRLYGARPDTHVHTTGDASALWPLRSNGNGRARRSPEAEKLEKEINHTRDQIDRAADRLDRMWRRGDRHFREKVLRELEKNGQLTPELRAEIANDLTRAHRLERQIQFTRNPEKRAALEAEYQQLTEEIQLKLADNGVELEFLKAVERAAGEEGLAGSLTGLLEQISNLMRELFAIQAISATLDHDRFALRALMSMTGGDPEQQQKDTVKLSKERKAEERSQRLDLELQKRVALIPRAV